MGSANATEVTSAISIEDLKKAFESAFEAAETFIGQHLFAGVASSLACTWMSQAQDFAYMKHDFKKAQYLVGKARVAAYRYHAGQLIAAASSLSEGLGQKADREAKYFLMLARTSLYGEKPIVSDAIRHSQKSFDLLTEQAKRLAKTEIPATPAPSQDPVAFQVVANTAMTPEQKRQADEIKRQGEAHVAKLAGKHQPQAAKSKGGNKKQPSKGKKHHLSVVA